MVARETQLWVTALGRWVEGSVTAGAEETLVVSDGWVARSCQLLYPATCMRVFTKQRFQVHTSSTRWDKEENFGSIWERFRL